MTGGDILRVEDLRVSFSIFGDKMTVVEGASLRILPGKVTALVGESGSGKSVIGQAIMGILPNAATASGRITFTDPQSNQAHEILDLPRDGVTMRGLRGGRMATIFQEPMTSLSPLHTIGDQVGEAFRIHKGADRKQVREKVEEILSLVGFRDPARTFGMYPFELSGGMRQRAMIAMALICDPALLIADEPTTALDVTIQAQILGLLKKLQGRFNMGMLLITHDLGVVANMADEVVVIYHGKIMEAGPVEDIFRRPQHPYLKGLISAVPRFDMKPNERLKSLRDVKVDIGMFANRQRQEEASAPASEVLLSVRNLSKSYTRRGPGLLGTGARQTLRVVNDVAFDIRQGECLGLVGESGCGKTTVSKMLMRGIKADNGSVTFNDGGKTVDVLRAHGDELMGLREKIQMVFQDPVSSLSPRMTVRNILSEPLQIHGYGDHGQIKQKVKSLIKAVGLSEAHLSRYPHSFSGGQRQRIGIARALAFGPKLVILDEPVSALDVSVQAQVLNLLKDLQKSLGLTYLFISHNLAVVDYMADRIAVMYRGRIVEIAPREILLRAPVHPYTRSLLAAVPYPDLDRPLDFGALEKVAERGGSAWDKNFIEEDGGPEMAYRNIGAGHFIRVRKEAPVEELQN